jgi:maltooligosyltrehalose trehalohydrolase
LIGLRRSRPALSDPRLQTIVVVEDENTSTLVMSRGGIRLFVNVGEGEHRFPNQANALLLAAPNCAVRLEHDAVIVPPDAVAIVQTDDR